MASPVPAKSQPLHNFNLPRTLKWNKHGNSTTNHLRRRSIKSPNNNPSPSRHSPASESAYFASSRSDSVTRSPTQTDLVIETRRTHHHNQSKNPGFVKSEKTERVSVKSKKKEIKKSSKILIKICSKNSCSDNKQEEESVKEEAFEETEDGVDEEAKTWNLRPRKPIRKSLNVNGSGINVKNNNGSGSGSGVVDKSGKAQSPVKNTNKSRENDGEKEKRRHSVDISLTKEEIEEDIYAFTGQKPSRRPKKRAKIVQKQVDFVFPGLWLVSIAPS